MIWLVMACSGKEIDSASFEAPNFYGLEHRITTYAVEDNCFDGAMALLFMPQGEEVPQEFQYPVYIPSLDELPINYEISLREPFVGMQITATDGGDGHISIGDGQMDEVELGGAFGECLATMDVVADITPGLTAFNIASTVTISNLRGDDERCPVPLSEACTVTLYMESVPWGG
jgi:hypothetical protein